MQLAQIFVLSAAFASPLLAAPRTQNPPLFNGKDLTGWTSADLSIWNVEEGAIVGGSEKRVPHNVFLWSPVEVEDFYLLVDVKLTPDNRNAGIQIRSKVHPTNKKEALGYQADVGAGVWGCLYHESGRQKLDWRGMAKDAVKAGEWNRYEILAVGDRIWGAINGKLSFAIREPAGERQGKIALQVHSGLPQVVRYKTLKLIHNPEVKLAGLGEKQLHAAAVLLNTDQPNVEAALKNKKTSGLRPRTEKPTVNAEPGTNWPRRIAAVDGGSKGETWAKRNFDDRSWKQMNLPVHWENAGLPDYDGVVWFRRTIDVPAAMAKGEALLSLGAIDDMDVTWVNGARVGGYEKAGAHFTPRIYKLPAGSLKPGKNLVAVRVMDHGHGGGLAATHGKMQLTAGAQAISLSGAWRYRPGASLAQLMASPGSTKATAPRPEPFKGKFELRESDVIAFAGGTGMVKQLESGYLEALLTGATRGPVYFRDIAWQADTVYRQQRPRNFGTHLDLLNRINATVVIASFGQMEALDGATRLPQFVAAYEQLLVQFAQRTPRIVLISPYPFEKTGDPNLPDLHARNGDVAAYAEAIRQLAKRRGYQFVDCAALKPAGLTSDGLQPTADGQRAWAEWVASRLLGRKVQFKDSQFGEMHSVIQRKNLLWRRHWRPTNWSFLYGNRQHVPSSHDHRPGKPRWFPEEINAIIPFIEQCEEEIRQYKVNPR